MTDHVHTARHGAVLHVTLARPEKKNALTAAMYEAMIAALAEAGADAAIRAVLIQGSGGCFSAGNDIGDFIANARGPDAPASMRFIRAIAACDTPIVAAVEGVAVGVGTTMLLHCDLAYAAPSAMFRMPFVDLGLVPEAASSLLVPALAGIKKASELLLLGEAFGAEEAARIGIVNAVVAADALYAHAAERARMLASKPPDALAAARRLMRGDRAAVLARIELEGVEFGKALARPEARDALMAFMAKGKK